MDTLHINFRLKDWYLFPILNHVHFANLFALQTLIWQRVFLLGHLKQRISLFTWSFKLALVELTHIYFFGEISVSAGIYRHSNLISNLARSFNHGNRLEFRNTRTARAGVETQLAHFCGLSTGKHQTKVFGP